MVASQYTGRLKVKHMVQARQFRKFHPDAHYASALYHYLRCFAVKYSTFSTFASLDDKHHCKVGEPNHPVAAVERGKAVLVSLGKTFTVSDHDFTQFSLIPSVVLLVDIPASPEESFHQGQVCIGLKDLALEPSSALRHATEFSKVKNSAYIYTMYILVCICKHSICKMCMSMHVYVHVCVCIVLSLHAGSLILWM